MKKPEEIVARLTERIKSAENIRFVDKHVWQLVHIISGNKQNGCRTWARVFVSDKGVLVRLECSWRAQEMDMVLVKKVLELLVLRDGYDVWVFEHQPDPSFRDINPDTYKDQEGDDEDDAADAWKRD